MQGKVNLAVAIFTAHDDLWDYGWLYLQLVRMLEWESEAPIHFSVTPVPFNKERSPVYKAWDNTQETSIMEDA